MAQYIVVLIESKWHSLNLQDFEEYDCFDFDAEKIRVSQLALIVTFQTSDFIRHLFAKGVRRLPTIIDLESLDKQFSQEGREYRDFAKWKALESLKYHKIIDDSFRLTYSTIKAFLEHLATLYFNLLERDEKEKERFDKIELGINRIIHRRQFEGIRIDLVKAQNRCKEVEKKIYKAKNVLQLEHGIFTPENEQQQLEYINSKGYNLVQSPIYTFKIWSNQDKVCKLFYELLRNGQDLDSLIYLNSQWGGQRTMPTFVGFGTITSRIIMRQPSLQNLRKSNRDVIIPDEGKKLLYIDYSQFEAGILASLSDEQYLIDLYDKDIYEDLAEKILFDRSKREEGKIIFYRYMYGDTALTQKAQEYFQKLKKLTLFKESVLIELAQKNKLGTVLGNYRWSIEENTTWGLSHVIQATASLIYKSALLRVQETVRNTQLLIPMHDGTLYQIDEYIFDASKSQIEKIYIEEFKKYCPKLTPKVNFADFYCETMNSVHKR